MFYGNEIQVNGYDIDPFAEKIYWQGHDISCEPKMWVVDYDGTNLQELFPSGGAAAVALDLTAQKLYWTELNSGKIRRANLDGSGVTPILTGLHLPRGLAFLSTNDPGGGKIYVVANPGALDVSVPAVSRSGIIALILLVLIAATTLLLRRRTSSSERG